jgi:hypothetical protein
MQRIKVYDVSKEVGNDEIYIYGMRKLKCYINGMRKIKCSLVKVRYLVEPNPT